MLLYLLIGLSLVLMGVAGLQFTYMFYLDRLHKERKKHINSLERKCRRLTDRLEQAEHRISRQNAVLEAVGLTVEDDIWADVIDDR
jgi:phosphopantetheine adenylyltransferase